MGRLVLLAHLRELLLVGAGETGLFGDRGGEFHLQQRNAIASLALSDQERQLVPFRPPLELGGLPQVVSLLMLAIRDERVEGSGQTLPFGLVFLDLHRHVLPFGEHLFQLLARA